MRVQNNIPRSAPIYVAPKPNAGTPDVIRVRNDGYEDIDQVLDVDILRRDLGLVGRSLTDILAK